MKWPDYITISGIILLLALHFCDGPDRTNSFSTKTDTIYVKSQDPIHDLPKKEYVSYRIDVPGPTSFISVPVEIDSGAVVRDYFSKRFYQDSTGNDSVKVYFTATTYKNELKDLRLRYRILTPTMVIRETKAVAYRSLSVGVDVASDGKATSVYPGVCLDLKKSMIRAGYDPFNKSVKLGVYWKVWRWTGSQ